MRDRSWGRRVPDAGPPHRVRPLRGGTLGVRRVLTTRRAGQHRSSRTSATSGATATSCRCRAGSRVLERDGVWPTSGHRPGPRHRRAPARGRRRRREPHGVPEPAVDDEPGRPRALGVRGQRRRGDRGRGASSRTCGTSTSTAASPASARPDRPYNVYGVAACRIPTTRASRRSRLMDRRSSGDLVAVHIRSLIFNGELRQGDRMRQDEIAQRLGVSRIPVREAIIALDREGWLDHHAAPGRVRARTRRGRAARPLRAARARLRARGARARPSVPQTRGSSVCTTRSGSCRVGRLARRAARGQRRVPPHAARGRALAAPRFGDAQHVDRRPRQLLRADRRQRRRSSSAARSASWPR